jgi:hypothetical protein
MSLTDDAIPLPPQFGDDPLSGFLKQAFENRLSTFHNKRPHFDRLTRIEKCFGTLCGNLNEPKDSLVGFLLMPRSVVGQLLPKWVVRDMSGFPPRNDIARCLKCVANRP